MIILIRGGRVAERGAVNISWVGGPLDIVHNGARRLSCAFGDADIASPAKLKGEKRKERERERGILVRKNKLFPDKTALILYSQKLVES